MSAVKINTIKFKNQWYVILKISLQTDELKGNLKLNKLCLKVTIGNNKLCKALNSLASDVIIIQLNIIIIVI